MFCGEKYWKEMNFIWLLLFTNAYLLDKQITYFFIYNQKKTLF